MAGGADPVNGIERPETVWKLGVLEFEPARVEVDVSVSATIDAVGDPLIPDRVPWAPCGDRVIVKQILVLVLFLTVPFASAGAFDPPPDAVEAEVHTDGSVNVTWLPPADAGVDGYAVYRDGVQVNVTTDTWFLDTPEAGLHVYFVTARVGDEESSPSDPVLVDAGDPPDPPGPAPRPDELIRLEDIPDLPGGCKFIGLFNQDEAPFFSVGIRTRCLDGTVPENPIIS